MRWLTALDQDPYPAWTQVMATMPGIFSSHFSDVSVTGKDSTPWLNSTQHSLFLPGPLSCHRRRTDKHFLCPEMDACYILVVKQCTLLAFGLEKNTELFSVMCCLVFQIDCLRIFFLLLLWVPCLNEETTAPILYIFLLQITGNSLEDYFAENILTAQKVQKIRGKNHYNFTTLLYPVFIFCTFSSSF